MNALKVLWDLRPRRQSNREIENGFQEQHDAVASETSLRESS